MESGNPKKTARPRKKGFIPEYSEQKGKMDFKVIPVIPESNRTNPCQQESPPETYGREKLFGTIRYSP